MSSALDASASQQIAVQRPARLVYQDLQGAPVLRGVESWSSLWLRRCLLARLGKFK